MIEPAHLWSSIVELARTQNDELLHTLQQGFKYIENQSFENNFQGLFSEINLDSEFEIHHGDSLLNNWSLLNEMNPAKKLECDVVVANPPFSYRWEPTEALGEDFRFKSYGLAPKSAANFAFLLHGFHFLGGEGTMAIILPRGVLFRGGAESRIRTL